MKIKTIIISSFVAAALLIVSCSEKKEKTEQKNEKISASEVYTCPMHPKVESAEPGACPKCGMDLEKKTMAVPTDTTNKVEADTAMQM